MYKRALLHHLGTESVEAQDAQHIALVVTVSALSSSIMYPSHPSFWFLLKDHYNENLLFLLLYSSFQLYLSITKFLFLRLCFVKRLLTFIFIGCFWNCCFRWFCWVLMPLNGSFPSSKTFKIVCSIFLAAPGGEWPSDLSLIKLNLKALTSPVLLSNPVTRGQRLQVVLCDFCVSKKGNGCGPNRKQSIRFRECESRPQRLWLWAQSELMTYGSCRPLIRMIR